MLHILQNFAAEAAAASESPVAMLGIDVKQLVFQVIAFGILVFVLSKWVFPVLIKSIDERQKIIEDSLKAAHEAEDKAAKAQSEIDGMLKTARKEAGEIVTTAKDEANGIVARAEEKSKAQAERIVNDARESIAKEVVAAKKELHNETIELVAQATEKVIGKTVSDSVDKKIITESLKEAK